MLHMCIVRYMNDLKKHKGMDSGTEKWDDLKQLEMNHIHHHNEEYYIQDYSKAVPSILKFIHHFFTHWLIHTFCKDIIWYGNETPRCMNSWMIELRIWFFVILNEVG